MISKDTFNRLKTSLDDSHRSSPILFSILASTLASIGLATNSGTTILGSMLFSPIGSIINESNIYNFLKDNGIKTNTKYSHWFKSIIIVILITLCVSYLFSMVFSRYRNPFNNERLNKSWPTQEMKDRAKPINALYMILIASVCSIALPLTILYNNSIRTVAIGIATALIPPLANIGLALGDITIDNNHRLEVILTGIAIFLINMFILWIPSKYLLKVFAQDDNIFKRMEKWVAS